MTEQSSSLFDDLPSEIQTAVRELGWSSPMPVQEKVIPLMHEGRDLIVQARTGSGKTGAFGIPIVERVDTALPETQALIMAPTRELANQVAGELTVLGKHCGVRCLPIYGGVSYGPQIEGLQTGAHVVVGTPGRMLDHLGARRMSLDHLKVLVLDEADELLSLGFWPDMRELHSYLPAERQSSLFSATIPEKVRSLSRIFLSDPQFVSLSEGQVAPAEIEHYYVITAAQEKEKSLLRILEYEDPESGIVFCNTKDDVRYVTAYLQRYGFDADQISGDLYQVAREDVMGRIKAGKLRLLVATDVAARGIDISQLSHVISYSAPESPDVYVHRTGRTGRAGRAGMAISLVSGLDIGRFRYLQQVNKIEIVERKLPGEKENVARLRERLAVKVEQEVRHIPSRERAWKVDRWVPVVEALSETEEGRRDLAAICAMYLSEHRPETSVREPAPGPRAAAPDAARRDEARPSGDRPGRRRRRPRRR